jgi:hypothetical protein
MYGTNHISSATSPPANCSSRELNSLGADSIWHWLHFYSRSFFLTYPHRSLWPRLQESWVPTMDFKGICAKQSSKHLVRQQMLRRCVQGCEAKHSSGGMEWIRKSSPRTSRCTWWRKWRRNIPSTRKNEPKVGKGTSSKNTDVGMSWRMGAGGQGRTEAWKTSGDQMVKGLGKPWWCVSSVYDQVCLLANSFKELWALWLIEFSTSLPSQDPSSEWGGSLHHG